MVSLWTVTDISEFLGLRKSTLYKNIICKPDFPLPIRPAGHPRWFAEEVQKWARQQRPNGQQSRQVSH